MQSLTQSRVTARAPAPTRSAGSARPQARRGLPVVRAEPAVADKKSPIETAIESARATCEGGSAGECAAAWDEVEELSASAADKKQAAHNKDPIEAYCEDNPEADECRVYED